LDKLVLRAHHDGEFLSITDALTVVKICRKRSYPRFAKWVSEQMTSYIRIYNTSTDDPESPVEPEAENESLPVVGVYLMQIGTVKDLRMHLDISRRFRNCEYVCSYGSTRNYRKRKQIECRIWSEACDMVPKTLALWTGPWADLEQLHLCSIKEQMVHQQSTLTNRFLEQQACLVHEDYPNLVILDQVQVEQLQTDGISS